MIRLIVAVLLAAVLQFVWGSVFWTVTPMCKEMIGKLPDESKVMQALKEANPETGVYFLPFPDPDVMSGENKEKTEEFTKRHTEGPLVQVIYSREGAPCMDMKVFALGFAHMVGGSLLAGVLLLMAGPG